MFGYVVVMVGDGVNDVLVLVVVDVGIVMGMGIDVVIESVGVIFFKGDLMILNRVCYLLEIIMKNI